MQHLMGSLRFPPSVGRLARMLLPLFVAGLSLMLPLGLALAQREPPGVGYPEAVLHGYGTRHALPLVMAPHGVPTTGTLQIVNGGWVPTHVVVVELGARTDLPAECPAAGTVAVGVRRVSCLPSVAPFTPATVALDGGPTSSLLVYSLGAAAAPDACADVERLRQGGTSLAEWEQSAFLANRGEPIAVTLESTTAEAVTGWSGRTDMDLRLVLRGGRSLEFSQAWPVVWPAGVGGRTRLMNPTAECRSVTAIGVTAASLGCARPISRTLDLAPYRTTDPSSLDPGAGAEALRVAGGFELVAGADQLDEHGWMGYLGALTMGRSPGEGQLAFPMAVAPLPNLKSELWIVNRHPTSTIQIDILMWDGNQKLKLYHDTVPLCAGATRRYDIQAIAGPIDPTAPRGSGQPEGPPVLSLRVEGTGVGLTDLPPLAGVMVLRSDLGVTAYAGMAAPIEFLPLITAPVPASPITVIPDVKVNGGDPEHPISTYLAIQSMGDPSTNIAYLDLYDTTGKRFSTEVPIELGIGLTGAGFLSMGDMVGRRNGRGTLFPEHFSGTAVLRDQNGFAALGVVAMDLPMPSRIPLPQKPVDRLASFTGVLLPRWPDPNLVTPTPAATATPLASPSATRGRPTPVPTELPPTTTGGRKVWLPWVGARAGVDGPAAD